VKCLKDKNVNSNITEAHPFRNIRIMKKQTQKMKAIPHEI